MSDPTWLPAAETFISANEGCKLTAYQDVCGVWTIGAGSDAAERAVDHAQHDDHAG